MQIDITGTGRALLLLHGAGGSPDSAFPFLSQLATSHTVIAPRLDTWPSDQPFTAGGVADHLANTLDDFGPLLICGYSMGTTIAVEFAHRHPDSVRAFALCAGLLNARPSFRVLLDVWVDLLDAPPAVLGKFILSSVYMPRTIDERGPDWVESTALEIATSFPTATRTHIELLRSLDLRGRLARTRQPLLVVSPMHDALVAPAHTLDLIGERPNARLMHLDCGHAIADEAPEQWLATLAQFFDGL